MYARATLRLVTIPHARSRAFRRFRVLALACATVTVLALTAVMGPLAPGLMVTDAPADEDADAGAPEAPRHVGAIVGRVRDADGNGIPNVVVRVGTHDLETRTDGNGAYHFYSVPAGRAVVAAERDGRMFSHRTILVHEGIVHQINHRLDGAGGPNGPLSVHAVEGRVSCLAVAAGAGVGCAERGAYAVNVTPGAAFAVVELAWDDPDMRLNLSVEGENGTIPVVGRPGSGAAAAEGPGPLRLAIPVPENADALHVHVRAASDMTGVEVDVPFVLHVSQFVAPPAGEYALAENA